MLLIYAFKQSSAKDFLILIEHVTYFIKEIHHQGLIHYITLKLHISNLVYLIDDLIKLSRER